MSKGLVESHNSMYRQLNPGDIEMGNSNPVLLHEIYSKIIDHITRLDDSRKKDGLNICFLSSGSARAEIYVLERMCKQIHRSGIKIKNVILVDTLYDEKFMISEPNVLISALDRLLKMNCLEKYSLVGDYDKLYENEFKQINSVIDQKTKSIDWITKEYKIDMFIAFNFQDNIFISLDDSGHPIPLKYIEYLQQYIRRFYLHQRLSWINKLCGPGTIPQKILCFYNENNKIGERWIPFPNVREGSIPGINHQILTMLNNDKIPEKIKIILSARHRVLIELYNQWKIENQSASKSTSSASLQSGGKYYGKYIANKNKYLSFHCNGSLDQYQ